MSTDPSGGEVYDHSPIERIGGGTCLHPSHGHTSHLPRQGSWTHITLTEARDAEHDVTVEEKTTLFGTGMEEASSGALWTTPVTYG